MLSVATDTSVKMLLFFLSLTAAIGSLHAVGKNRRLGLVGKQVTLEKIWLRKLCESFQMTICTCFCILLILVKIHLLFKLF